MTLSQQFVCSIVHTLSKIFNFNSPKGLEYEAFYENLWQLEQDYTNYIENFEWNQQRREKYAENNDEFAN